MGVAATGIVRSKLSQEKANRWPDLTDDWQHALVLSVWNMCTARLFEIILAMRCRDPPTPSAQTQRCLGLWQDCS